jgi:hypothetical protein
MIGSHGESMRGLLRPGFHSGTVPKLFRKLRRATPAKTSRLHHELEHAGEAVDRFVDRELAHLLACRPEWKDISIHVEHVRFGCRRVEIQLGAKRLGRDPFVLVLEIIDGKIEAFVEARGWTEKLTESMLSSFVLALRGLLDMSATDRVYGKDRTDDVAVQPGFADLVRRVTWEEWVANWDGMRDAPVQ